MRVRHVAIDGRVISDHFPGIGRYTFELVRALATFNPHLQLSVLVRPGQTDRRFRLESLAQLPNAHLVSVAAPVFGWRTQLELPRVLHDLQPDLFHATYWVTAYRPRVPTVLSLYDLIGRQPSVKIAGWRGAALEVAIRLALRATNHVITLSEASKRDLMRAYALESDSITVTHLAADAAFHPPPAAAVRALRDRLGLPPTYVLYVGINKPHKNLETLIHAFAALAEGERGADDAVSRAVLVIAGRWDARYDHLKALAAASLPAGRVRFLGPVDDADLPALYGGAAVFAFPSRYEGFGLPPLEAMACGTPVVVSDASSLPEVVGDAGILVHPDDVSGWREALGRVLADTALAERLGKAGLARSLEFTWQRTAVQTVKAYERATRRLRA